MVNTLPFSCHSRHSDQRRSCEDPALFISTVRKPYPGIMALTGWCPTSGELAFHIYESFLYKVRADVAAKSNSLGTLHY
jgi:hypothetical protein